MKKLLVGVAAILFMAGWTPASSSAAENPTKTTVNASSLNVRAAASPKAKKIGSLKKGAVIYIHAKKPGGWAEIRYNKKPAYVAAAYLKNVEKEKVKAKKVTVDASSLNVRSHPSPKAKKIGSLKKGAIVYIHASKPGGWAEIRYNGKPAYVAAAYLK